MSMSAFPLEQRLNVFVAQLLSPRSVSAQGFPFISQLSIRAGIIVSHFRRTRATATAATAEKAELCVRCAASVAQSWHTEKRENLVSGNGNTHVLTSAPEMNKERRRNIIVEARERGEGRRSGRGNDCMFRCDSRRLKFCREETINHKQFTLIAFR